MSTNDFKEDHSDKCLPDFMFVDEYLLVFDQYVNRRIIDFIFGAFLFSGIIVLICTFKRGRWKLKFIKNNQKLIKD